MTPNAASFPTALSTTSRRRTVWAGRVLSAIPVVMLVVSAALKLSHSPQAVQMFVSSLGYPESLLPKLAVLELTCVALYAFPRTAVLGAILVTGYLGGAITSHLRIGEPFAVQALLAILAWGGLFLRDERLRALLPFRAPAA
jgi:hypothetical protein